jgi:hypothetical protein
MLRVPRLVPAPGGLKDTEMAQLAPALTVLPQVLVWEKSPVVVMPKIVSEELPVLVSVTVWALLLIPTISGGKVSKEEDRLTWAPIPVPLKVTTCGLPPASSVTVSVPVHVPLARGVKVTLNVQFAPAANEAPQSFVWP